MVDFDKLRPLDLKEPNLMYSPFWKQWFKVDDMFFKKLVLYLGWRQLAINYRKYNHDGENLTTATIYQKYLDKWADAINNLKPYGNLFSRIYFGYSLN